MMVLGEMESDFSDGGRTLSVTDAVPEFSVAVSVTGVGAVTCPACIWNCIHPVLPGILRVAGTGTRSGFELARLMIAPFAGAAVESCNCMNVELPL